MMITSPIAIRRSAWAIAGLGGVVWMTPPPLPRPEVPPPIEIGSAVAPSGGEQAAALLEFDDIVRRNVFVPERRPPASPTPPPASPRRPSSTESVLRLYGVARGPQGAVALIDADPTIPGAEIYRPGDQVAGYQLQTIDATFVVLEGPSGRRTLHLALPRGRLP